MSDRPGLSEAEMEGLKALGAHGPGTVRRTKDVLAAPPRVGGGDRRVAVVGGGDAPGRGGAGGGRGPGAGVGAPGPRGAALPLVRRAGQARDPADIELALASVPPAPARPRTARHGRG